MNTRNLLLYGLPALVIFVSTALYLNLAEEPNATDDSTPIETLDTEIEPKQSRDIRPRGAIEPVDSITRPRLLRNYGSLEQAGRDDLELIESALQRFWLLFKNPDLLNVGSNEDILKSLTGDNPDKIQFISPDNRFIDAQGRLLDRWGTPLRFHPESMTYIDIRSAGPDRDFYTHDDEIVSAARSKLLH